MHTSLSARAAVIPRGGINYRGTGRESHVAEIFVRDERNESPRKSLRAAERSCDTEFGWFTERAVYRAVLFGRGAHNFALALDRRRTNNFHEP